MNHRKYRRCWMQLALALLTTLACPACSTYQRYEASRPENIRQTEAMLSEAGFAVVRIDTAGEAGLAANLPPHELRSYDIESGTVYWYYDPDVCGCVYEGHQAAYDSYEMAMQQQQDTAAYVADSEQEQVASLNALNDRMFPLPSPYWLAVIGGAGGGFFGGRHHGGGGGHHGGGGGHHGGGGGGHHGGGGGGGHGHR